jgi:pimeloyl-ACP methyl ester carboxylesterase
MSSSPTHKPVPADAGSSVTGITREQLLQRGLAAGLAFGAASVLSGPALAATAPPKAPRLPAGFEKTFTSRMIDVGTLRLHAVIGGSGPPLLLIHGWPQNWYQWRLVMPALARDFTVVAVDQRGIGLSDKPKDGYDSATQANDMVALMQGLGHRQFAVVGFDTGMPIGYALAADHPDRLARLAVGEAVIVGVTPSPPLFLPEPLVSKAWHLVFNRLPHLNEELVRGREDKMFGYVFDVEAGTHLPRYAVKYYIDTIASSRHGLRGSFGIYRAFPIDMAKNEQRMAQRLSLPVLAVGGERGLGESVVSAMKLVADNVQSAIIRNCGHWVAEEKPQDLLAVLTPFLAPYAQGAATGRARRRPVAVK